MITSIILGLLPSLLNIVSWIIGRSKANEETKQAFLKLIEQAKMDPAICLKMKDSFKTMEDDLKAGKGL